MTNRPKSPTSETERSIKPKEVIIMPKFFITGLYQTEEFNDSTLPPIEVEVGVDDRIVALASIGATVWTEEEWMGVVEKSRERGKNWPEPIKAR